MSERRKSVRPQSTLGGRRLGKTQQKILLLLLGGFAMGMTHSPKYQYRILRGMIEGWQEINGKTSRSHKRRREDWTATRPIHFRRAVDSLYKSKLIKRKDYKDGSTTIMLSDKGRKRAVHYHLRTLSIRKPKQWDGKWRVVMYDIPEEIRNLRYDLHATLRSLGFVELQHSVFAHPYECKDEIEFLIEAYDARPYVRRMLVEEIDITEPLRKAFTHEARKAKAQGNVVTKQRRSHTKKKV